MACSAKSSGDLRVALPQKLPASKIMAVTLQGAPAKLLHGELATAAQLPFTCLAKPPFLESSGGKPFCSQLLSASRQHPLHFLDMDLHGRTLKHSSVCRHLPHLARDGAWIAQISSSIGACHDLLV